jgi:ribonuclease Z
VFIEPPQPAPINQILHLEPLERNRDALLAERGISNPQSLLGPLLRTRQPITLPDGYVLQPPPLSREGRKVVILGDTSDPSHIVPLALEASLVVHEATNAYIPAKLMPHGYNDGNSEEKVRAKAISRGHSTPVMAGEFARTVRARRLVMNHFSAK